MNKLIVLIARNIVNHGEIESFIRSLIDDLEIEKQEIYFWMDKQLKDYIQNRLDTVITLDSFKDSDPDWLKRSVKNKTALKAVFEEKFIKQIHRIIDYFNQLPDKELSKIPKLTFEAALKKANEFVNNTTTESTEDVEIVREYPNKFSFVRLLSRQALFREGTLMHHCTKKEENLYFENIQNGTLDIYSLRDTKNRPHCTIEVNDNLINQIKGYNNGPILKKYIPFLKDFIQHPIKGGHYAALNDLNLAGIVEDTEGVWQNMYKLPANCIIDENLDFTESKYDIVLPKNLTINKNLYLSYTKIKKLPDNLTVYGSLFLTGATGIKTLPENLNVGTLYMGYTNIEEIPNSLEASVLNIVKSKVSKILSNKITKIFVSTKMRDRIECSDEIRSRMELKHNYLNI